jgi:hypothetical protein
VKYRLLSLLALVVACGSAEPRPGRVVVVLTIDWEGAYVSPEGLDAYDVMRETLGSAPFTHFVSSAYFTKPDVDRKSGFAALRSSVLPGDELAVHLHAWRSLAQESHVEPKLSPSFLTGTEQLLDLQDGDLGFDTDLDVYSVVELRAMIRTSRHLLEQSALPVGRSFRAGGYLGTPKVLQAIYEEGYTVDSSATDYRQLDEQKGTLPERIHGIWPAVEATTQPFWTPAGVGKVLELPIAAIADYAEEREISALFELAFKRLAAQPDRDVFVVLGFHQETANEFGNRLVEAIAKIRDRSDVELVTVAEAARRARER